MYIRNENLYSDIWLNFSQNLCEGCSACTRDANAPLELLCTVLIWSNQLFNKREKVLFMTISNRMQHLYEHLSNGNVVRIKNIRHVELCHEARSPIALWRNRY
jgi:hypothetical protein